MLYRSIGRHVSQIGCAILFILLFVCPCCCFGALAMFDSVFARPRTLTVVGFSWEYEVRIEAYEALSEQGFCDLVPDDAYDVKVNPDGDDYEMCAYTVDRWEYARSEYARGDSREAPAPTWPEVTLAKAGIDGKGAEREAARVEIYRVHYEADNGKVYTCPAKTRQFWDGVKIGSRWQMRFGRLFRMPQCDTLQALSG